MGGGDANTAEIKKLVPEATAMTWNDYMMVFGLPRDPTLAQLEKPSLTFLLVDMHPPTKNVKEAEEEFELISSDEVAYPVAAIHDEVKRRVGKGPAAAGPQHFTMIQIDRITDITCQANGDVAKGTVSYEVPGSIAASSTTRPSGAKATGTSPRFPCPPTRFT